MEEDKAMKEIVFAIVLIGIVLGCYLVKSLKKYSKNETLRELVAWCVTKNSNEYRCNLHLHEYVGNAQIKGNISVEYRISGEAEWNIVKEIISFYQIDMTQMYFTNRLSLPSSRYSIPGEHYFMYSLQSYLEEQQCDYTFNGHDMHKETISHKNYGSWGGQLFDATYALSDYSLVLHKLYYISYMFCKRSQVLNSKGDLFVSEGAIEDIIDSKRITLSRC
jgi:hypothetical protein